MQLLLIMKKRLNEKLIFNVGVKMQPMTVAPHPLSRIPSTSSILRHPVPGSKVYIFEKLGKGVCISSFLNHFLKGFDETSYCHEKNSAVFFKKALDKIFFFWY
jgi:hypothetical protein